MIKCYCASTPNSRKVLMTLEECGFAYERKFIDLARGEQNSAAHLELNPTGAVPVLIDTNGPKGELIKISQSLAICLYLANKSAKLLPEDPELNALVLQWSAFGASDLAACTTALFLLSRPDAEQERGLEIMRDRLSRYFAALDRQLAGNVYIVGEFSLADVLIYPILLVPFVESVLRRGPAFANIEAWLKCMANRPAIKRGM